MKLFCKLFLIACFFGMSSNLFGQQKTWIDEKGKAVTELNANFYRVIKIEKNNKKHITDFFLNGIKAKEFIYENGKPEGKSTEFYPTGELKTTGKYKEGLKDGVWKSYYKNGKIKEKGNYFKGEKVGVWKVFYKNV